MVVRNVQKVIRPKSGSKKRKAPAVPDDDAERWFNEEHVGMIGDQSSPPVK